MSDRGSDKLGVLTRLVVGFISGGLTSYILTQCSLRGVDFSTSGIDSEIIKGTINGTIVGFVVAPRNIIYTLCDGILFVRFAARTLWLAIRYGKEEPH